MSELRQDLFEIDVGTRKVRAALYRRAPANPAEKCSGVLFLHEIMGVRSWVKEDARDLAAEGYAVLVPDLYSEMGVLRFCIREFFTAAGRANSSANPGLREVFAVLDFLKNIEGVDGERIGAIGQCLTGGFALHLAKRPEVKAPVVYHHSLGLSGAGISPDDAGRIQNTIQGHYAESDPLFCPRRRQEALRKLLGNRLEYHLHLGVGHGIRSRYRDSESGRRAWGQTKAFFARNLKGAAAA